MYLKEKDMLMLGNSFGMIARCVVGIRKVIDEINANAMAA